MGWPSRASLALALGAVEAARRALVGDGPSHHPGAVDAVLAFLESRKAVLRDVAFDLRDVAEVAEELRADLERLRG